MEKVPFSLSFPSLQNGNWVCMSEWLTGAYGGGWGGGSYGLISSHYRDRVLWLRIIRLRSQRCDHPYRSVQLVMVVNYRKLTNSPFQHAYVLVERDHNSERIYVTIEYTKEQNFLNSNILISFTIIQMLVSWLVI